MTRGRIAELEVLSLINEPTAAAIAYGLDKGKNLGSARTVFIYDLGGGTFDVTVMRIEGNEFKVLASGGDTHLGGQDFDVLLLKHCLEDMNNAGNGRQMTRDKQVVHDLRKACEMAKLKLSSMPKASVRVFSPRLNEGYDRYETTISRALFQSLCGELFRKTIEISEKVLTDAQVKHSDIDDVVLVGGSTRIPKVRALLQDMFSGKELRHSINPDEAVAYGAAVHAAALSGDELFGKMVKLEDVTPLSLGTDVIGGRFSCIIKKNTAIPCKNTETYCTTSDNQCEVSVKVYQGERPLVKDNHYLNKDCRIEVPMLPAGQARVKVTYEIDKSGLLTVTCEEPTSGRQVQARVTSEEAHLSQEDIHAFIENARRYRREDQAALREVEEQLQRQRPI
ncbi:Heat shock 70 kDa protein [Frankliniella fusca]|uniref:Heat shock 70 kDa protein n=1 Tax=Frankliniella fusca TaxID=407009 RepID=A0AAE1LT90_9NEOP|nr:Heat shock 70 kDa protein [Frankliniella fusca]